MFSGALLTAFVVAAPPDADLKKRAEDLVARLGDPSFKHREKAARELLDIGYPAKDAVLAGQTSPDTEISDRCQKLYPIIWRTDLERRVEKFLNDPDGAVPGDLPGATKWIKVVGDGNESRKLYAEMVKGHPETLVDVELHPDRLTQAYQELAKEAYSRTLGQPGTARGPVESEVSLFFFLGAVGEVRPTIPRGVATTHVYQFLNAPAMHARLPADSGDPAFRRLFAAWLEKERYVLFLRRGVDLAVSNKVRECVPVIIRMATDTKAMVTTRATALLGLGRLGTKDDLKELGPLLKDETQVCLTVINAERATAQMRDVALGAALALTGQDPKDYGFDRRPPANVTPSYVYYVFTTDEKRAAAHAKWANWAAANLKK